MTHLLHEGLWAASKNLAVLKEKGQIQSSEALWDLILSHTNWHVHPQGFYVIAICPFSPLISHTLREDSLVFLLPVVPPNVTLVLTAGKRGMLSTQCFQ